MKMFVLKHSVLWILLCCGAVVSAFLLMWVSDNNERDVIAVLQSQLTESVSMAQRGSGAVEYNCALSGGTVEEGVCVCPIGDFQTQDQMYDQTTGFCQSDIGGPASNAFSASVGLPWGAYDFWYSIINDLCEHSGGFVSDSHCTCPSGVYDYTSGTCVDGRL